MTGADDIAKASEQLLLPAPPKALPAPPIDATATAAKEVNKNVITAHSATRDFYTRAGAQQKQLKKHGPPKQPVDTQKALDTAEKTLSKAQQAQKLAKQEVDTQKALIDSIKQGAKAQELAALEQKATHQLIKDRGLNAITPARRETFETAVKMRDALRSKMITNKPPSKFQGKNRFGENPEQIFRKGVDADKLAKIPDEQLAQWHDELIKITDPAERTKRLLEIFKTASKERKLPQVTAAQTDELARLEKEHLKTADVTSDAFKARKKASADVEAARGPMAKDQLNNPKSKAGWDVIKQMQAMLSKDAGKVTKQEFSAINAELARLDKTLKAYQQKGLTDPISMWKLLAKETESMI